MDRRAAVVGPGYPRRAGAPAGLRIEMVLPTLAVGGQETMATRLALALCERGHDVGATLLEDEGPLAEQWRAAGCDVALVPTPGLSTIVHAPALVARLRARGAGVVHIHDGVWLKAARAARAAGASTILHTMHGLGHDERWFVPSLRRVAARYTDAIVTVSQPLHDYLRDAVRLHQPIHVIPNGVDTDVFHPAPRATGSPSRHPWPADAVVLGHVARLDPIKNQEMLLRGFARLRTDRPDAHLVIAGSGPQGDLLRRLAAGLGLEGSVHFMGEVAEPADLYRSFDLFALTSDAEGTSMSILEAMASGVPVVATDVGGSSALLEGGRCGVLVPARDESAFAGALAALLADEPRRRALSAAARERAVRHYGQATMCERYEALYAGRTPDRAAAGESDRCVE